MERLEGGGGVMAWRVNAADFLNYRTRVVLHVSFMDEALQATASEGRGGGWSRGGVTGDSRHEPHAAG